MSKSLAIIFTFCSVIAVANGCDFLRRVAGGPTSAEIKVKAESMLAAEAAKETARQDSIQMASRHLLDSAAAVDSLQKENVLKPRTLGDLAAKEGLKKYYVIVGSFSSRANAERFSKDISGKGFPSELIQFKNGYTAVGIRGTDDVIQIRGSLNEVRRQDFCPEGVWILVNE